MSDGAAQPTTGVHNPHSDLRKRVLFATVLILTLSIGLVFPFPISGRLWGGLFDLAHAPAFCLTLVSLVGFFDPAAIGLPSRFRTIVPMNPARILLAAIALMAVGAVGELLQSLARRNPSWHDVLANSAGLAAGLVWILSRRLDRNARRLMSVAAVSLLITSTTTPILEVWDCLQQIRSFPVLASFERPREIGNWAQHESQIERSSTWATDGIHSLKVSMHPGQYPGVTMVWLNTDWSAFRKLNLDIRNPNPHALRLILKLQDSQDPETDYVDRFHQEILIAADQQLAVKIDLDAVAKAPENRRMDMTQIQIIDIFCVDLEQPATFLIDNVRLVK